MSHLVHLLCHLGQLGIGLWRNFLNCGNSGRRLLVVCLEICNVSVEVSLFRQMTRHADLKTNNNNNNNNNNNKTVLSVLLGPIQMTERADDNLPHG